MVETRYVDGDYLTSNPGWHAPDSPFKASWIQAILERNAISPKSIAEIGCGAGEILVELSRRYPSATFSGFDVSPQALEIAAPKANSSLTFHHEDFISGDRSSFDVVMAIDVFEHVPDYMGFIRGLAPKGTYKLFHIPLDLSVSSVLRSKSLPRTREIVGHLHYFTKETALATLVDCGLEVIDWNYTHGTEDLPNQRLKTKIMNVPRRILRSINEDLSTRLLGGTSAMVLTK